MSIPLCFFVNTVVTDPAAAHHTKEHAVGQGMAVGFVMLAGIVSGVAALCGIPKYGAKGILGPALTGVVLWLGLAALGIPTFQRVQQNAQKMRAARTQRVNLTPMIHTPGTERLQDAEYGFSFDIPRGFQPLPPESKPKQYRYAYVRLGNGGPTTVILVTVVNGAQWAGQHVNPADIPRGSKATIVPMFWRGLTVDSFRVPDKTPQGDSLAFNVQIPLKKHTVQIGIGGPAAKEAELRALTEQTLASLEGEPNWP